MYVWFKRRIYHLCPLGLEMGDKSVFLPYSCLLIFFFSFLKMCMLIINIGWYRGYSRGSMATSQLQGPRFNSELLVLVVSHWGLWFPPGVQKNNNKKKQQASMWISDVNWCHVMDSIGSGPV